MGRHRITWGCFQTVHRVTCSFELTVFQNIFPSLPPKYFYGALSVYPLPLRPDVFFTPHVFSLTQRRVTSARNKRGVDLDICIGDDHVNADIIEVGNEGMQLTVVCLIAYRFWGAETHFDWKTSCHGSEGRNMQHRLTESALWSMNVCRVGGIAWHKTRICECTFT
jgi:hypothetical protein